MLLATCSSLPVMGGPVAGQVYAAGQVGVRTGRPTGLSASDIVSAV